MGGSGDAPIITGAQLQLGDGAGQIGESGELWGHAVGPLEFSK